MGDPAELLDRQLELGDEAVDPGPDRLADARAEERLGVAGAEQQPDEALLGPVVQVALEAAPLAVAGRDDPGP